MTDMSNVIPFAARPSRKLTAVAKPPLSLVEIDTSRGLTERAYMGDKRSYALPALWEHAVEGWISWLTLGGTRPTTLRLRRGHVRSMARRSGTQHPRELTLSQIVNICSDRSWSNEHRKGLRRSLISFYEYCVDKSIVSANPAAGLPRVSGEKPRPRPCPDDVWLELLAASTPRVRMMARLAGEVGMRRAEVAVCRREDLIADVDGWVLIVHGKGGRQRVVPVTDSIAEAVREFCPRGYLFPGQIDGHISPDYVGRLLSRLMPAGWSMHKLRHRYATRGLAGTGNLIAVKEALGHASVATTQIYTAVASRDVRAVSEAAGAPLRRW